MLQATLPRAQPPLNVSLVPSQFLFILHSKPNTGIIGFQSVKAEGRFLQATWRSTRLDSRNSSPDKSRVQVVEDDVPLVPFFQFANNNFGKWESFTPNSKGLLQNVNFRERTLEVEISPIAGALQVGGGEFFFFFFSSLFFLLPLVLECNMLCVCVCARARALDTAC